MAKWIRTGVSAVVLVAIYWIYAGLVVPLLEPTVSYRSGEVVAGGVGFSDRSRIDLSKYFAADAWQLDEGCLTVETSQGVLLFRDFDRSANGSIKLTPLSLILHQTADPQQSATPAPSDTIILDAPEGAELHSDTGLDLTRMQFGTIVGGHLQGPVTIRSADSTPPEKRLLIATRDVKIDGNRIWTPHRVDFQYGASKGSGANLVITTEAKKSVDEEQSPGNSSFGEVKSVELVQLDHLELHLDDASMFPLAGGEQGTQKSKQPLVLEVACRGSFFYDVATMTASFDNRVQTTRVNPSGPADRLLCNLLALEFGKVAEFPGETRTPDGSAASSDTASDSPAKKMGLVSLTASGTPDQPVILEAPSQQAGARGSRLHYNGRTRSLQLEQPGAAWLQYQNYVIRSPRINYTLGEDPNRLGEFWAEGPGAIEGMPKDRNSQPFSATWKRLLQLERRDDHHVFSFYEQVHLSAQEGQGGRFDAERIHLYVQETPTVTNQGKTQYEIRPLRMRALEQVSFDSPELSGETAELNVFFEPLKATVLDVDRPTSRGLNRESKPILEPPSRAAGDKIPTRKFHVAGRKMELRVLTPEVGRPTLDDVTVAGAVEVRQTKLDEKDRGPLQMNGDILQMSSVSRDRNTIVLKGRPGRIAVGPISMEGEEIVMDQQANTVFVDRAGKMTFPSSKHDPQRITTVNWQEGMDFDGLIARFRGDVVADGTRLDLKQRLMRYHVEAGYMAATINRRLNFRELKSDAKGIELAHMKYDGGVHFENQSFDPSGKMASHDKMQANNLNIDQLDGRLSVNGPGWASTARFSSQRLVRTDKTNSASAMKPEKAPRLNYLHIKFEDGVVGNILDKRIKFLGGVVAVHGPINEWGETLKPNQRGGLGKEGVELRCDELAVIDVSATKTPMIELIATGNTIVENELYGASAQRLTFTESKSLLVLDGDSTYDAKLKVYGPNPKSAVAKRIMFWTDTYDFDVDRVQSIQFGSFGKPPAQRPKPLRTGRLR